MLYICPYCDEQISISLQYEMVTKCRGCGHIFNREKFLIQQRSYILKKIDDLKAVGFEYVRWNTSNDQHVCLYCQERANRLFTFDEVKQLIKDNFCQPKDLEQGCRCFISPAKSPAEILQKPKRNPAVKVISNMKTEIRDGETVKKVVFDLKINRRKLAKLKKKQKNKF